MLHEHLNRTLPWCSSHIHSHHPVEPPAVLHLIGRGRERHSTLCPGTQPLGSFQQPFLFPNRLPPPPLPLPAAGGSIAVEKMFCQVGLLPGGLEQESARILLLAHLSWPIVTSPAAVRRKGQVRPPALPLLPVWLLLLPPHGTHTQQSTHKSDTHTHHTHTDTASNQRPHAAADGAATTEDKCIIGSSESAAAVAAAAAATAVEESAVEAAVAEVVEEEAAATAG